MNLITLQATLDSVPDRWREQYRNTKDPKKIAILERLLELPKPLTKDAIDTVIGNQSWTTLTCHECGKHSDKLVEIGGEDDNQSSICPVCLAEAARLSTTEFYEYWFPIQQGKRRPEFIWYYNSLEEAKRVTQRWLPQPAGFMFLQLDSDLNIHYTEMHKV